MIIYKCCVSGDEVLTDAFQIAVVDEVFFKVQGKLVVKGGGDIDDSLIGGNPSENPEEEDVGGASGGDPTVEKVPDVVQNGRLVETGFSNKKAYQGYLKDYMKKVVAHLEETSPDRVAPFKAACGPAVKKMLEKFKDLQFFMGEGMNPDGIHILCDWDGETPFFYFFKDGLIEEKV